MRAPRGARVFNVRRARLRLRWWKAEPRTVHGGVPAKPIRAITEADARTLAKKTKKEIPEDLY